MMWRKQYRTKRERRIDRVTGFIACFVVTALSFVGQQATKEYMPISEEPFWEKVRFIGLSLPWLLTILAIGLGLYARPEFGLGYLTAIITAVAAPLTLAGIFFASCFAAVTVSSPLLLLGIGGPVVLLLWIGGFFYLLVKILGYVFNKIQDWWDEPEWDRPEIHVLPREKAWVPVPDITWENDVPEGKGGDEPL